MAKGQIGDAAKWIFIVIVGIFMLGLFLNLVFKNIEDSKSENEAMLLNYLQTFITNTRVNPNYQIARQLPSNIVFEKNKDSIVIGLNERDISDVVLYGPSSFDSNSILGNSIPFTNPFYITNTLVLFDQNKKYLIVHDLNNVDASILENLLPDFLQYEIKQYSELIGSGSVDTGLIDLNTEVILITRSPDSTNLMSQYVSAIDTLDFDVDYKEYTGFRINNRDRTFEYANITMSGSSLPLIDKSMFIGSIASDSLSEFNAQTSKLLPFMKRIYILQINKTSQLEQTYPRCIVRYDQIKDELSEAIVKSDDIVNSPFFRGDDVSNFIKDTYDLGIRVDRINGELRGLNCPRIY